MSGQLAAGAIVITGEPAEAMRSAVPPALHQMAGASVMQHVIDTARAAGAERVAVVGDTAGLARAVDWSEDVVVVDGLEAAQEALAGLDRVFVLRGNAVISEEMLSALMKEAQTADDKLVEERDQLVIKDRATLAEAERLMRERLVARHLAAGVTFRDPSTVYIDRDVRLQADVTIEPNCYLYGTTLVAPGAVIGPGTTLRNATVGAGSRVEQSVVEDSTVGEETTVGPFAHVRGGSRIGDGCEIHNYAEVKNSVVGDGVKMHHFGYLGDADVGARANIGAGAVTVNYDGVAKHRTSIGALAFVGCDTMLIAPVSVGEGAFTAAGAVVTHDVEAGKRVAGVPARELPDRDTDTGEERAASGARGEKFLHQGSGFVSEEEADRIAREVPAILRATFDEDADRDEGEA